MNFVELDRNFVTLQVDRPYRAEVFESFPLFGLGGEKWPSLLEYERVVVLAEAASGKTEEFRHRSRAIRENGGFSIFLPIERLEKNGLAGSLGIDDREAFEAWRRGGEPGWFFLDSIDEARIHHKDVESALNRFAVELGEAYQRARVLLSCRGSVWSGAKDLALINLALPIRTRVAAEDTMPLDPDIALLDKPENSTSASKKEEAPEPAVRLFALAKITRSQRSAFLTAEKVTDIGAFEDALFKRGLDRLAERPGDLKTLVRYWKQHGTFGDLTEMVEFGIVERLAETNESRRASIGISDAEARAGAERLAAAMTLGQTVDLVLPNIADGNAEGINPRHVLDDWNPRDVDGLLHRGLFAPSSFGRLRFHHRSAQEYLTACWFQRLGPRLRDAELYRIFLANAYGVNTIPPSLRAAAAWVAQAHQGLREHILDREPHVLLTEGDPRKLSIIDRAQLLTAFAAKQLAGNSAQGLIDHKALWMFADERLVPAIHKALSINDRADFRFEMLRLIQLGKLKGCNDVALQAALDHKASPYHRIVATQALVAIEDAEGLNAVAVDILSNPRPLSANLAPAMAIALFPTALTVDQLLQLIATSQPAREYQVEGFDEELLVLYERCPTEQDRRKLMAGLAKLAFEPPLNEWPRVSKRNAILATKLGPIAKAAVARSDNVAINDDLLKLLHAATHAREENEKESPSLGEIVFARPALNQALFWANVAAETAATGKPVTKFRNVSPHGPSLWRIDPADTDWLFEALKRPDPNDRLVAIDTLITLAFSGDANVDGRLERLQGLVAHDPILAAQVTEARTPREETEADKERREKWAGYERQKEMREEQRRQRWRRLRAEVQADSVLLCDPKRLAAWPGPLHLLEMTRWLTTRSENRFTAAALNWKALEPAFGPEAANAYRRGMKVLWRVTSPERPQQSADGQRTVKYSIILSMAGLAIEAAERPDWAKRLSADEAVQAARHICIDDQTIPEWLGTLLLAHAAIVAPLIATEMIREWHLPTPHAPFLESAARSLPIEALQSALVNLLFESPTNNPARVATASDIVLRLKWTEADRAALTELTLHRLSSAVQANEDDMSAAQLKLLFRIAPERATTKLIALIEAEMVKGVAVRAPTLLRNFFGQLYGSVINPTTLGPKLLGRLVELAYALPPSLPAPSSGEDEDDTGAYRDFDNPRNGLVSALAKLDGEEAYRTMVALSRSPVVGDSGHRLREIARGIAERGSERRPWPETFARQFEANHLAPIATGADLLELTCALVDDINWSFAKADMSARAVVETAKDERAVQEWLGSTLQTMSNMRFQAHREAEVAKDNRPDILITATSAPVEVAIEVKHGDKGWTLRELREALHVQLAEQYLLQENRRHGVLIITNHRNAKFWRDTEQQSKLGFSEVIQLLQMEASAIISNSCGSVRVEVRGIDAAPGIRAVPEAKNGRLSGTSIR